LTRKPYADGTTYYGCDKTPGLVTGESSAFEEDEPKRCEGYEHTGTFVKKDVCDSTQP